MDPITILQNRIEQLEAKLGLFASGQQGADGQQGDSATNSLPAAPAAGHAAAGREKLGEAVRGASELNNYTDPHYVEMNEQQHLQAVSAAEPGPRHHCACTHQWKQAAPVFESEPIQHVPEMQETVNNMHKAAAEVKAEAEAFNFCPSVPAQEGPFYNRVSHGLQEVAETCGPAAAAGAQPGGAARKADQAEQKLFPQRRNGLD